MGDKIYGGQALAMMSRGWRKRCGSFSFGVSAAKTFWELPPVAPEAAPEAADASAAQRGFRGSRCAGSGTTNNCRENVHRHLTPEVHLRLWNMHPFGVEDHDLDKKRIPRIWLGSM